MKRTTLCLMLTTVLFSTSIQAQVEKSLVGFQNIPWGTKLSAIKAKQSNLQVIDMCVDWPLGRKAAKESNSSCRRLEDKNYLVGSTNLELTYSFDFDERLTYVTLNYQPEQLNLDELDLLKKCSATFDNLSYLLTTRYGSSFVPSNSSPQFGYEVSEYQAWLPSPTEIWIAKSTGSSIKSFQPCSVKIKYSPRHSMDAKKL